MFTIEMKDGAKRPKNFYNCSVAGSFSIVNH